MCPSTDLLVLVVIRRHSVISTDEIFECELSPCLVGAHSLRGTGRELMGELPEAPKPGIKV